MKCLKGGSMEGLGPLYRRKVQLANLRWRNLVDSDGQGFNKG